MDTNARIIIIVMGYRMNRSRVDIVGLFLFSDERICLTSCVLRVPNARQTSIPFVAP